MCNKCELDFNNLIRSLNSKKNLFNNKNDRDNSFGGNNQQIGTASKAPKNVKWKEEYGEAAEDSPDEVCQPPNHEEELKIEE